MTVVTAKLVAIASQYSGYRPDAPHKAKAGDFAYVTEESVKSWCGDGSYAVVGTADVTVRLHDREEVTRNAVVALRKQQQTVRANANAEAQRIEERIQSLLAITNEVRA